MSLVSLSGGQFSNQQELRLNVSNTVFNYCELGIVKSWCSETLALSQNLMWLKPLFLTDLWIQMILEVGFSSMCGTINVMRQTAVGGFRPWAVYFVVINNKIQFWR